MLLSTIKIIIADDHAVVREGTRQILEREPDLEVVAEACDEEQAMRLATSSQLDIANVVFICVYVKNMGFVHYCFKTILEFMHISKCVPVSALP